MKILHFPLGFLTSGTAIEVTLSGQANVMLLDKSNFYRYRQGRQFRYHGGLVKHSPFRLQTPTSGEWHVAIDLGGGRGRVLAELTLAGDGSQTEKGSAGDMGCGHWQGKD